MKAFLSHSSGDKPVANIIYKYLRDASIDIWFDKLEMRPGVSLLEKISQGIEESDYLLVLISEKSKRSVWVQKEISVALSMEMNGNGPNVIPILIEDTEIPAMIADKLYLNVREDGEGSEEIVSAIFRDSFIFDLDLSNTGHSYDVADIRAELYEYIRLQYDDLRVRINKGNFVSDVLKISKKASKDEDHKENLKQQIKSSSEAFDIELPIYWSNLSSIIRLMLVELFTYYGKTMDSVKIGTVAVDRTLYLSLLALYKKLSPAVFDIHAEKYGYHSIAQYVKEYSKIAGLSDSDLIKSFCNPSLGEELILAELTPKKEQRNIGARFQLPIIPKEIAYYQMRYPADSIIPDYYWFTICLPQLAVRHLHWTALREGRPLNEIEYDVGFKLKEYESVGLA